MRVTVKTKIWLTIFTVVCMFSFFILFYFPSLQQRSLLKNYNSEIQNLANTVALGVKIAITEQNFEGVQVAMDFVKEDPHLKFVSLLQTDTVWNDAHDKYELETTVFKTYPEFVKVEPNYATNDSVIVKRAVFQAPIMSGEILLGFSTDEIKASKQQIMVTSLIVSSIVFIVGILIGFWLARTISIPVLKLRDAAHKVGRGDLTQRVISRSKDEIGELGYAFNKMVDALAMAKKEIEEKTNEALIAKQKTDELLLNILPAETAEELKANGMAKAKNYDMATVLFADFKGFTEISERMKPEKLVYELNYCFSAFDAITQKHGIEKIKTIGDAYMCAGGLPGKNSTHAHDVVNAAMEMRDFILSYKAEKLERGEIPFEIRIGINTGPVVAGIVGIRKFAYDIWGDTVNIASRMESCSETGKINISGSTYNLVKDEFVCSYRGRIKAKGVGEVEMYFVEDVKIAEPA